MKRFLASIICTILCSPFAVCQVSTSFSSLPNGWHGTLHFGPRHFGPPFSPVAEIAGAPFSAEATDEDVQTIADGTHIQRTSPGMKIYRDSMGRTRTERHPLRGPMVTRPNLPEGPTIVEINDPVAHVTYVFDLDEPIAHRQEWAANNSRGTATTRGRPGHALIGGSTGTLAASGANNEAAIASTTTVSGVAPPAARRRGVANEAGPQTTTENLGTQVIEGIPAEGTLQITTWPVGSMGNDRPITNTAESWISPELKEVVLRKRNDPRLGDGTHRLFNINRSVPDPSLFEPPPGYTVKDEKRDFTINWTARR